MRRKDNMFLAKVCKAKKLPTGSILVYDDLYNEYFAINSLVKQMDTSFENIINGKITYILFEKEVWTGKKWNNKEVNKIIFIADQKEEVIKFLNIIIEKEDLLRMTNKNFSRIIESYETDSKNFKKFNSTVFVNISEADIELRNILKIQSSNEITRNQLTKDIDTLRKRLDEIYKQIELMQSK